MSIKISIVTVVFNSPDLLEQTIKSVISQDYRTIEYIIIDGGSTDSTNSVIDKYRKQISTVISEKDNGIYDAMNKGIDLATGDYITFLNAGDTYTNTSVLSTLFVNTEPMSYDLIYGNAINVYFDGSKRENQAKDFTVDNLLQYGTGVVCHQAFFLKKGITPKYESAYKYKGELNWYFEILRKTPDLSFYNAKIPIVYYSIGGAGYVHLWENKLEWLDVVYKRFGSDPIYRYKYFDNIVKSMEWRRLKDIERQKDFNIEDLSDLKVLHVSGGRNNTGAGKGAMLLHKALINIGINSKILFQFGEPGDDKTMIVPYHSVREKHFVRQMLDNDSSLVSKYKNKLDYIFSPGQYGIDITELQEYKDADIVHFHWINRGFIAIDTFSKISKPIVWTMRDMWPFTGGCHYTHSVNCDKYESCCGSCPHLGSDIKDDLSAHTLDLKKQSYGSNLYPVGISHWLSQLAQKSSVFSNKEVLTIYNCIDIQEFEPQDKILLRKKLNFELNEKIILFGALSSTADTRKGYKHFLELLQYIDTSKYHIVVFGAEDDVKLRNVTDKITFFGYVDNNQFLSEIYSIADVFVAPYLQDAFGKTVAESMACGTPVITFESTGPSEIVEHKKSGFHAKYANSKSLKDGIDWIFSLDESKYEEISNNARKRVVNEFSFDRISHKYAKLYRSVIPGRSDKTLTPYSDDEVSRQYSSLQSYLDILISRENNKTKEQVKRRGASRVSLIRNELKLAIEWWGWKLPFVLISRGPRKLYFIFFNKRNIK